MKIDAAARRVLGALVDDPDASVADIALVASISEDVARERLERLRRDGAFLGRSVRLDAKAIGFPCEALVLGRPSAQTSRASLQEIGTAARVTRMFTLAAEQSIALTIVGHSAQDLQETASQLAKRASLEAISVTLLVETLADDTAGALHRAWTAERLVAQ